MSGLQKQIIPVPLAQGVDTKDDPKQIPIGKLLTLENGFFQTPGEIRKRYGFNGLSTSYVNKDATTGTLSDIVGLSAYNDQAVVMDRTAMTLYGYSSNINKWYEGGYFYPAKLTTSPVSVLNVSSAPTQTLQDGVYDSASGLQCFTWLYGGNAYYSVLDKTTGKYVVNAKLLGTFTYCKVMSFSSSFVFLTTDGSGNLKCLRVTTANPLNVITVGTLATDVNHAAPLFDATIISSRLFIAYNYVTTGFSILYLNTSFTASSELIDHTHAASSAISITADGSNNVAITYSNGSNVYCIIYDSNLNPTPVLTIQTLSATASINQITSVVWGSTPQVYVFMCAYINNRTTNSIIYASYSAGGTGSAGGFQLSCSIASKAFVYGGNTNGHLFLLAQYCDATTGQPTLFLLTFAPRTDGNYPARVVGKIAAANAYDSTRSLMPEVTASATGVYEVAYSQNAGVNEVPIWGSTWNLTIDLTATPQTAQIANILHISGGQLWAYDGSDVVEHGFHLYPVVVSITPSGTGVLAASSDYQYIAVYEWVDGQGQLNRSATSIAGSFTTGGSGAASVAVTVSTLCVTNKRNTSNNVQIYIYRTAANGTIFYYAGHAANNAATNNVTITDANADADLIANVQLYTTGGQVDNTSAPACSAVVTYKSRLVVIPSDNPYSWWFSQEVIPSSAASSATPVELSDLLIQNIDQLGGPITGVNVIDDKLVLLKKTAPYYVVGNGPAPNGTSNDYSTPQIITSPVGSINAASIVQTPFGLMFQAANSAGIWLLDRSLTASYIGSDVELYNSQTVTSATLYPTYNQVRFTTSGGVCLVFDYIVKQWSVYTNIAAVQACLFQGSYTFVNSAGLVLQETTSSFTDNGTFVSLKVGTSWMQLAGLQGFQRIYEALILGDYESAHTLNANVYYDFDPTVSQTTPIVPTSTPPYQWRLLFTRQKCEAIKIELYDTQNSPAEGLRLSAITLKVGVKGGLNRMPAARTFE